MYYTYLQFFLTLSQKFILDTQKQMSDKKMGLTKIDLHRDQQFQISSLIEDSSEGSSRRDEGYEIKNYDVSDDQQHDKKSIKSLQQIQTHDLEKQIKNSPNMSNRSHENEQLPERAFNNQQPKQLKDDFEISRTSAFQTQNKAQISNSKRKRQQIFRNSRKSNIQKPVNFEHGAQESESKLKQIVNRVAFQKKRENHTILKHWNYCRIRKLEFHRAIADEIVANIDKNVKIALQNLQVYKSFYTQRVRQQQIYANTIFTDSDRLLQNDQTLQNNDHSNRIYIACSSIIQAVARKDKRQKQIAQNLANTIQTKILKGIFEEYFDNVHKQSLSIRQKINQFKTSLYKIDENVCNKLISLQTNFTQCCQDVNKEASKDFYRLQLSFLRKCETQMIIQAKYGQIIVEYYNFVISEQEMRRQLIEKSLRLYEQALQKYHTDLKQIAKQKQPQPQPQQTNPPSYDPQQQKQQDRNKIKQIYKLKNLINNEQMQRLQQQINKNCIDKVRNKQISQQNFLQFFQKCQIQYFDSHHLVIKKFDVSVNKQDTWVDGSVVISVDKFVHFFVEVSQQQASYGTHKFLKPQITIKANMLQIVAEEETDEGEGVQVKIVSKASQSRLDKLKSLIKTSQKVEQKVKFTKQSDFIEFEDYINNFSQ